MVEVLLAAIDSEARLYMPLSFTRSLRYEPNHLRAMMFSTSQLSNCISKVTVASLVPIALRQADLLVSARCSSEQMDEETDQLRQ
jgi:hypothetical protein